MLRMYFQMYLTFLDVSCPKPIRVCLYIILKHTVEKELCLGSKKERKKVLFLIFLEICCCRH